MDIEAFIIICEAVGFDSALQNLNDRGYEVTITVSKVEENEL